MDSLLRLWPVEQERHAGMTSALGGHAAENGEFHAAARVGGERQHRFRHSLHILTDGLGGLPMEDLPFSGDAVGFLDGGGLPVKIGGFAEVTLLMTLKRSR